MTRNQAKGFLAALCATVLQLVACSGGSGTAQPQATPPQSAPPSITAQPSSATVNVGASASFSVTATGSTPLAYQWRRNGSSIAGATSSSYTTGAASTSMNGSSYTVVVENSVGTVTSNAATLNVNPAPAPQITTSSLPAGSAQSAYTATLAATGGTPPYNWSISSGQLPPGLALAAATGVISGTPTSAGTASFTVKVVDAEMASTSLATSIVIKSAPIASAPFRHVVIVVEENENSSSVVGNSAMPYLNALISEYGLATQYYANTHPSIGNYFMLTTGEVLTNDDNDTPSSFPVSADNAVRELISARKTWKAYAESIPSVGYTGGNSGNYAVRHVPLAYLTDVQDSATQKSNLVPFTEFAADLAAGQLPNYSFVTPNLCDDAHNCAVDVADNWLKTNIAPLLTSSPFKDDGLLIILFDESANDDTHGGGKIPAVLVSPAFSKKGYRSTTLYQHESTLRLMLEGQGVTGLPGAAATAPPMWEFFTFPPPP